MIRVLNPNPVGSRTPRPRAAKVDLGADARAAAAALHEGYAVTIDDGLVLIGRRVLAAWKPVRA